MDIFIITIIHGLSAITVRSNWKGIENLLFLIKKPLFHALMSILDLHKSTKITTVYDPVNDAAVNIVTGKIYVFALTM